VQNNGGDHDSDNNGAPPTATAVSRKAVRGTSSPPGPAPLRNCANRLLIRSRCGWAARIPRLSCLPDGQGHREADSDKLSLSPFSWGSGQADLGARDQARGGGYSDRNDDAFRGASTRTGPSSRGRGITLPSRSPGRALRAMSPSSNRCPPEEIYLSEAASHAELAALPDPRFTCSTASFGLRGACSAGLQGIWGGPGR